MKYGVRVVEVHCLFCFVLLVLNVVIVKVKFFAKH